MESNTERPRTPTRSSTNVLAVHEAPLESRPGTRRKTSWLTTKMSRNSSLTSKSRSIPIFVHVGELLKPSSSSAKLPLDQETNKHFSEANPKPVQSDMGASRTSPSDRRSNVPPQSMPASQPNTGESKLERTTEEKATGTEDMKSERHTKSIYSLFPEPPDPLEHFDKWFPATPSGEKHVEEKQKAFVNKSLPQPPYHVFDRSKKLQLVILVSFAGILSPLSTSIYLPALIAIASVCIEPQERNFNPTNR
jgi:hypothetical protein